MNDLCVCVRVFVHFIQFHWKPFQRWLKSNVATTSIVEKQNRYWLSDVYMSLTARWGFQKAWFMPQRLDQCEWHREASADRKLWPSVQQQWPGHHTSKCPPLQAHCGVPLVPVKLWTSSIRSYAALYSDYPLEIEPVHQHIWGTRERRLRLSFVIFASHSA